MEWDDLRFALAVARYGGIAGAARNLKVNHSTVFRHIAGIEARLGVHLFERLPSGYSPTMAGKRLLESAERVEEEILAMQRQIAADTPGSGGTVRVTTTDAIAAHLIKVFGSLADTQRSQSPNQALNIWRTGLNRTPYRNCST